MIAVLQEKLAQDPLGAVDIALGEHPGSREHGCGQSLELQCLLGRCGRRVCLSARPAKHSEGLPGGEERGIERDRAAVSLDRVSALPRGAIAVAALLEKTADRKSTRLNSSHVEISYAVFCLKKKKKKKNRNMI